MKKSNKEVFIQFQLQRIHCKDEYSKDYINNLFAEYLNEKNKCKEEYKEKIVVFNYAFIFYMFILTLSVFFKSYMIFVLYILLISLNYYLKNKVKKQMECDLKNINLETIEKLKRMNKLIYLVK